MRRRLKFCPSPNGIIVGAETRAFLDASRGMEMLGQDLCRLPSTELPRVKNPKNLHAPLSRSPSDLVDLFATPQAQRPPQVFRFRLSLAVAY